MLVQCWETIGLTLFRLWKKLFTDNRYTRYKVDSTLVHSEKSLLIVKLGSFQNASIEIQQISFVYQQNRFTVIVVLMITDLILAFVKVGLVYIFNIYIR